MRETTFHCDQCDRLLLDPSRFNITIGSPSGDLYFKYYKDDKLILSMDKHTELHFCNDVCFNDYFIRNSNPELLKNS